MAEPEFIGNADIKQQSTIDIFNSEKLNPQLYRVASITSIFSKII